MLKNKNEDFGDEIAQLILMKPPKKRKKENMPVPAIIHELKEDLDRELDLKAKKNNLTANNVKNMLKAVITDSEVIKMIDNSLANSNEKPAYELKLTRAKTKELIGLDQNALWNMPIIQKNSDIEALINEELSEHSSDEEYEPLDEPSDEDIKVNEITVDEESVIDDEYSECEILVKATPPDSNENNSNENIGQRTRSKLCLSETPLEKIEQSFIPPDITTDMYNTHCDQDWLDFLKEFYFDSNQPENNDDENDPEYNVMVDEEIEGTDIEELRMDRAVKVTKKELNELMSELFEYTEMLSSDDDEENRTDTIHQPNFNCVTEPNDSTLCIISPSNGMKTEDKIGDEYNQYHKLTEKQNYLLIQQLQQHVQLLLQSFLFAYKHPLLPENYASECRKRILELESWKSFSSPNSYFCIINLEPSLELMDNWVKYLDNHENMCLYERFMSKELRRIDLPNNQKHCALPKFHPKLIEVCLSSYAFLYPLFLPKGSFTGSLNIVRGYSPYENQLIAMGLEQFSDYLGFLPENYESLRKIVELIHYYLITTKSVTNTLAHIKRLRSSSLCNPIKEYFQSHKAPPVRHFVVVYDSLKRLCEYPKKIIPHAWVYYNTIDVENKKEY